MDSLPRAHPTSVSAPHDAITSFDQVGDFVDFQTLNVLPDELVSTGWTPSLHAFAGVRTSPSVITWS